MDLKYPLRSRVVRDNKNVGLFSDTDLVSDRICALALHERVQRKVIETPVSQTIPVV